MSTIIRNIEPKLVSFLNSKILAHPSDNRDFLVEAAKACLGVKEKTGKNDGEMVELLQETIGGHSGEPWCMSFVQSMIAYIELRTGVKSPLIPTEHCMTAWRETPKAQRVVFCPKPGAIAIWKHGNTDNGHTGIVVDVKLNKKGKPEFFRAVEGNTTSGTGPKGEVVRDGGGVHLTTRSFDGSGSMKVVGFLKPF